MLEINRVEATFSLFINDLRVHSRPLVKDSKTVDLSSKNIIRIYICMLRSDGDKKNLKKIFNLFLSQKKGPYKYSVQRMSPFSDN